MSSKQFSNSHSLLVFYIESQKLKIKVGYSIYPKNSVCVVYPIAIEENSKN